MLNIENIDEKYYKVVNSKAWKEFQEKFNKCNNIFVLGHGGNLAVADHAAVDISRLSNGTKNAQCPGSAVVATSLINDTSFDQWMVQWLRQVTTTMTESQKKKTLIFGISSSGGSRDLIKALQWGYANGLQLGCITAQPLIERIPNKPEDISHYNTEDNEIREHSFPDETKNIGVDFDGVIHKNSKGYYDGTIYDEPIVGSKEALKKLSKKYDVVMFTAKAKADRGLVNGKTGTQLVWEWLKKHNMDKYVTKVTSEKPRAVAYIDDKGITFDGNWDKCVSEMENKGLL